LRGRGAFMGYSMAPGYAIRQSIEKLRVMSMRFVLMLAAFGAAYAALPADARPREREQDNVYKGTQQGRLVPLRLIEARILPRMRGFTYLGPEFDPGYGRYRLKFMRGPQVVWIDVDARTGDVIGMSGR
jgi:hypothetical protein